MQEAELGGVKWRASRVGFNSTAGEAYEDEGQDERGGSVEKSDGDDVGSDGHVGRYVGF